MPCLSDQARQPCVRVRPPISDSSRRPRDRVSRPRRPYPPAAYRQTGLARCPRIPQCECRRAGRLRAAGKPCSRTKSWGRSRRNSDLVDWRLLRVVPQRITQRDLGRVGPKLCVLLLAVGAGAFLRDLAPERDVNRNLVLAHRLHAGFACHRLFNIGRELLLLVLLPLDLTLTELRHYLAGEQFKRLADMLVPVTSALLDEHRLIHAGLLEMPQVRSQLIRRADAVIGAGRGQRVPRLFEIGPNVGAAGLVFAKDIMMRQSVTEEPQAILAAAARFHFVRV